MKNLLIFFLNGRIPFNLATFAGNGYQNTVVVEQSVTGKVPGGAQPGRETVLELEDKHGFASLLSTIESVEHVLIVPCFNQSGAAPERQSQAVLKKTLLILKNISRKLMLQRAGRVWLLEAVDFSGFEPDTAHILKACFAGLKHLIYIYTMELAKKGITANYIRGFSEENSSQLLEIFKWSEAGDSFYYTAQTMVLAGRSENGK